MRLPDFSLMVDFIRLRQQMGVFDIPILPPVRFARELRHQRVTEEVDPRDRQLLEQTRTGAVTVSSGSLAVEGGLLTYKGRKVAAYIRDQRQGINWDARTSSYRFHLCDCTTLQAMRQAGRERRYLATRRRDGWFPVNDVSWTGRGSGDVRLELCMNCRDQLRQLGKWFEPFSLAGFLDRFDTDVPRTIRRVEVVTETQTYQPGHADRSREYRKAVGYKCQVCAVVCIDEQHLLHLHHRDGDPSNNDHHNLAVLCIECHASQPLHGHMGRSRRDIAGIARIRELRLEQGIIDYNSVA